jgi:glutamate synthase domain-containing protein 2
MTSDAFDQQTNQSFPPDVIARIHEMADSGQYPIRGLGARRKVPTFDDLVFLTASVSRYPLEGYRERCETRTVLGARHATRPITLEIPITIAGMSFGALSATAKEALGRAATAVGTSTTTGDGGMTPEERKASSLLVYQVLPSRYGFDPADLRQADAVEIVVGTRSQARWRWHVARSKGECPGGGHAHPSSRHRPTFGQPSP